MRVVTWQKPILIIQQRPKMYTKQGLVGMFFYTELTGKRGYLICLIRIANIGVTTINSSNINEKRRNHTNTTLPLGSKLNVAIPDSSEKDRPVQIGQTSLKINNRIPCSCKVMHGLDTTHFVGMRRDFVYVHVCKRNIQQKSDLLPEILMFILFDVTCLSQQITHVVNDRLIVCPNVQLTTAACSPFQSTENPRDFSAQDALLYASKRPKTNCASVGNDDRPSSQRVFRAVWVRTCAICERMPHVPMRHELKNSCLVRQTNEGFANKSTPWILWNQTSQTKALRKLIPNLEKFLMSSPDFIIPAANSKTMLLCVWHVAPHTKRCFASIKLGKHAGSEKGPVSYNHQLFTLGLGESIVMW